MQNDLIRNDHQRHLITIRLICTVHDKNFIIDLQNALRTFLWKEKMSHLIETILLKRVCSVILVELMHQCLHRSHRFKLISTHLCLNVVHISSFYHEIDECRIERCEIRWYRLECDWVESDRKIESVRKTNDRNDLERRNLNCQLSLYFDFHVSSHDHSSQNRMNVDHTRSMIMFFIPNLEYSRISVFIAQLSHNEKKALNVFAIIVTTILFCALVRFSFSIAN